MAQTSRLTSVLAAFALSISACTSPSSSAGPDDVTPESLPFADETTTTPPDSATTAGDLGLDSGEVDIAQAQPLPPPATIVGQPAAVSAPTSTTEPAAISDNPATSVPPATTASSSTTSSSSTTNTTTTTTKTAPTTTTAPMTTTSAAPATPTLVWSEEFDSFDSTRWTKEHSTYGDGGKTLQCYTPQQVSVSDGSLVLTAEARTETCPNSSPYGPTRDVTSGMVRSKGVTFSPGQRIVYRVKLTPGDQANQGGLWPALWASGWAGGGWPTGGEWDGFEVMTAVDPKRAVFGLHYANSLGSHAKSSKATVGTTNFSTDWHNLEFDYGRDGVMTWRMDGVEVVRQTGLDTLQGWPAPFNQAMTELKINLALGGNPGPLDERALPATYAVDYVRIYDLP